MEEIVLVALRSAGDFEPVQNIKRVHGGDINESYFVQTSKRTYFLKYQLRAPKGFFRTEVEGLRQIQATNTVSVPNVYAYSEEEQGFLLLEWLKNEAKEDTEERLGKKLSELHHHHFPQHGYPTDTYIGTLPQQNGLFSTWLEYYRDCRLLQQFRLGIQIGRIQGKRRILLEKLFSCLDQWIPMNPKASLLHGDLWSGNWIAGPGGEPFLIDPSVLYGDRHFDLAFTELFGGFSPAFYRAYHENYPLSDRYEEMKPLYQLYYLLVHLNLFGEAYGASVDRILKKYVG